MGVYRWYVIFPLILFSALSHAATPLNLAQLFSRSATDADVVCFDKPVINTTFKPYIFHKGDYYVNYQGCIYVGTGLVVAPDGQDYAAADWKPIKATPPGIDMPESQIDDSNKPVNPDVPDITPPVKPPVKPDTSSVGQLFELYSNCISDLAKFPPSNYDDYNPAIDYNYNARVKQCNSIYDNMNSLITTNSMSSPSDDNHKFITKDGSGNLYSCIRNPLTPQQMADMGKLYPGEILGNQINKRPEREIGYDCQIVHDISDGKDKNRCKYHLNFNYVIDNGKGTTVCNSVYNSNLESGDSGSQGEHGGSCFDGQVNYPGQGCVVLQCNPGYHQVAGATPTDYPSCQPDTGTSGGGTDSGDDSGPGLSTPSLDVPELTLSPLWNIWPSARDFKLSLPVAQCPVFNIEVFGTNHKIDTFCTLFTPDIIAIIRAICILTASIISFIIVLRS